MKKRILILAMGFACMFIINNNLNAQLGKDFGKFTSLTDIAKDDFSQLFSNYMKPFGNGFCAGLSNGWYNTAKVHKLLGFDVTVNLNVAQVPTSDQTYQLSSFTRNITTNIPTLLSKIEVTGVGQAQTISGENVSSSNNYINYNLVSKVPSLVPSTPIKIPATPGLGVPYVPTPMVQIGLGLFKQTEIMVRYIPTQDLSTYSSDLKMNIGLMGFGIKHSISQWIPVLSDLKFLHLSGVFGWTRIKIDNDISDYVKPSIYKEMGLTGITGNETATKGQKAELTLSGMTADVVGSFDLSSFFGGLSIFAGAGVSPSKSSFKLTGDYYVPTIQSINSTSGEITYGLKKYNNPLDIRLDDKGLKPHATVGGRMRLLFLQVGGSYTFAKYNIYNLNVAITIR